MNTNIKKLVIYTVKDQFKSEYKKVQSVVKSFMQEMPGYKSILSYRSFTTDNQLMGGIDWDNLENALNVQKQLESHSHYNILKEYLENITFADHFKN